jgi:pyruvate/2-oxoglutarate dehydrogenase complex dihydrolipoamide dehydrogenase (E3) component
MTDVIVIGAEPAGVLAALRAADLTSGMMVD